MGSWTNNDGLTLKFGTDKAQTVTVGEYRTNGALREVEIKIDLTTLTEGEVVQSDFLFFPKERIKEVEVVTNTAATAGAAIDLGLIRLDRTTEIDYNGFLAAFPTSQMDLAGERTIFTAATTVPAGATGTGALIGTTIANPGYITCSRTTATAFTAGSITVTIRWYAI